MAAINGSSDLAALAASTHSVIPRAKMRPGAAHNTVGTVDGVQPNADGDTRDDAQNTEQSPNRAGQTDAGQAGAQSDDADSRQERKNYNFALDWASDTWGIPPLPEGIWSLNADDAEGRSAAPSEQQPDHQPGTQTQAEAENVPDGESDADNANQTENAGTVAGNAGTVAGNADAVADSEPDTGDVADADAAHFDTAEHGEEPTAQDADMISPQKETSPSSPVSPNQEPSDRTEIPQTPRVLNTKHTPDIEETGQAEEASQRSEESEQSETIEASQVSATSEQSQSTQTPQAAATVEAPQAADASAQSGHTPNDEASSSPVSAQHPPIEQTPATEPAEAEDARRGDGRVEIPSDAPSASMMPSDMQESGNDEPTEVIDRDAIGTETGPLPYNIPPAEMTGRTAAIYESTNEFPFSFGQPGNQPNTREEEPFASDETETTGQLPATDGITGNDDEATVAIPADAKQPAYQPAGAASQAPRNASGARVQTPRPAASSAAGRTASPARNTLIIVVVIALLVCAGIAFVATRHRAASPAQPSANATTSASATATPSDGASASSSPSPSASLTPSPAGVYTNDTMGYRVSIPDGYVWHDETDNGATRSFTDDSIGMTITVTGASNTTGATVASEYSACASGHSVSYHLLSGDIMVCSYAENGTITYVKEIVTQQSILSLRFDYAQSAKDQGSAVIDEVFPTFVSTR
ncbi:hypothetical protein DSM100238_0099 [Bifidobacterium apri]|uniref:Uncharacterized protein n=2 Tax=Bifidobacterium apri TaxID=1769423 RepID=A0A6A2VGR2_9BIFI|nr:hypothetical protein DSM100238_0099 [Bifidobacterium apri]